MRVERWVILTRAEAEDLRDALAAYLEEEPPDPGWHHHLGGGDDELTLAVDQGHRH
jgi:hypothetical protein